MPTHTYTIPDRCADCVRRALAIEYIDPENGIFAEECEECAYRIALRETEDQRNRRLAAMQAVRSVWPIPRRFAQASLDECCRSPFQESAAAALRAWAERLPDDAMTTAGNVILRGSSGSGKTHLAAACLRACEDRLLTCAFANTAALFETLRRMLGQGDPANSAQPGASPSKALDVLVECQILLLDDLGAERPTPWVRGSLYYLVNERYNHCRPTVVTTNYTAAELSRDRTWAAILSRLIEGAEIIREDG